MDRIGEQEGSERDDENGDVLEHGIVHTFADLPVHHRDQRAGGNPAAVGEHREPGDMGDAELLAADGNADGEAIDHQRGAVVDQALGPQHSHDSPRQRPGQHPDGGGVGGRDRGPQHPARSPGHAECVGGRSHCGRRGHHQRGTGENDHAHIASDLAQRRGQALPVEQRREEQQQDDLGRQAGLAQGRDESDQHSDQHQQDRRCHRVSTSEGTAHHHRDAEDDHNL